MRAAIPLLLAMLPLFAACIATDTAHAQGISISQKAAHDSMVVQLGEDGTMAVTHTIKPAGSPRQLDLLGGTLENLAIKSEDGSDRQLTTIGANDAVLILPSDQRSIVTYEIGDRLEMVDGYWTLDFAYRERVTFVMPEGIDSLYTNGDLTNLDGKSKIACNGCQLKLEYSFDELQSFIDLEWVDREFTIGVQSLSEVEGFAFDQPTKSIVLDVGGDNEYLNVTIPLELLWEPYMVYSDEERIAAYVETNNGTHATLVMRPETAGDITIIGTTVIPEFTAMVPLAAGLLAAMAVPLFARLTPR